MSKALKITDYVTRKVRNARFCYRVTDLYRRTAVESMLDYGRFG